MVLVQHNIYGGREKETDVYQYYDASELQGKARLGRGEISTLLEDEGILAPCIAMNRPLEPEIK